MGTKRTDLAVECREIWQNSAGKTGEIAGVSQRRRSLCGYEATEVRIASRAGEAALGKPRGTYVSLDLTAYWSRRGGFFARAVEAAGRELKDLMGQRPASVLVVGLGNRAMTPDAVGPETLSHLLVTRHITGENGGIFGDFCPVAALGAGVLGTTGMESAEIVRGAVDTIRPAAVILVDALASRRLGRICTTVQLTDTGLTPGSGVGNHRAALTEETLGTAVYSIGVPTVVDAATLAADMLEEAGAAEVEPSALRGAGEGVFVTTRDIDAQVREMARVVGYGINFALHGLNVEEITALLQ